MKDDNLLDAFFRIQDNIVALDNNFIITYVNQSFANTIGLKVSEMIDKDIWSLLPKEVGSTIYKEIFEALAKKEVRNFEWQGVYVKSFWETTIYPSDSGVTIISKDITERKKAEEELRNKQRELNLILDSSPTIIFHKNKEGKVIQANRAFAEALKTTKEELVGKTVFDIYSAEIAQAMTNDDSVVMASKTPKLGIIEPYESPTGLRWLRTDKIPTFDENSNVTGLVGFSEEITEHKQAEDALRIEKERFESLANSLPEIVFETDDKGNAFFGNKRGFEIIGYTQEDFAKGINVFSLIAPQDKEKAIEHFNKILKNQPTVDNEYTVVRKDGRTFPAIIVANAIFENERPIGLRGLVIDITERKKTEEALKETEEKLQKIINQSPVVFELYDKSGFQVQVNPAWDKLWGVPREYTLGKYNILQSEQVIKNGWVTFIERGYAGETVKVPDLEYDASLDPSTKGLGRKRWLSTIIYPLKNEQGEVTNIAVLHEDITEQKKLEKKMQEQDRLVAIGQTAGMVGHDLRNPLQSIAGEVYLAKNELSSLPDGENKSCLQESIQTISEQVSYMDKIVSDLQTFVKPIEAQMEIINLKPVITALLAQTDFPKNIQASMQVDDQINCKG